MFQPYLCGYCRTMSFANFDQFQVHVRRHKRCCILQRSSKLTFPRKLLNYSNKIKHEGIHTKEKPYQCSYCNKRFSRVSNKTRHERTHTKEKPYPCSYCDKSFSRVSHKTDHERTHTKEKPYPCSYCDKCF